MTTEGPFLKSDDKMQQILEAAITVFSEAGFRKTTMQDVATQAGVGKGTIYLYFSSKEELLGKMLLMVLQDYLHQVQVIAAEEGSVKTRLEQLFLSYIEGAKKNRQKFKFLMQSSVGMGESFKRKAVNTRTRIFEEIQELVQEGIDNGTIRPVDAATATHAISGAMDSLAASIIWRQERDEDAIDKQKTPRELARSALECVWLGLSED